MRKRRRNEGGPGGYDEYEIKDLGPKTADPNQKNAGAHNPKDLQKQNPSNQNHRSNQGYNNTNSQTQGQQSNNYHGNQKQTSNYHRDNNYDDYYQRPAPNNGRRGGDDYYERQGDPNQEQLSNYSQPFHPGTTGGNQKSSKGYADQNYHDRNYDNHGGSRGGDRGPPRGAKPFPQKGKDSHDGPNRSANDDIGKGPEGLKEIGAVVPDNSKFRNQGLRGYRKADDKGGSKRGRGDQNDQDRDYDAEEPRKNNNGAGKKDGHGSKRAQDDSRREVGKKPERATTDCLICLTKVYIKSAVWYCGRCYVECHLSCIKQWIQKQNNIKDANEAKKIKNFSFACPHCNFIYTVAGMPKYYCYCGKTRDPEFSTYSEPHTCENVCNKKRGENCPHLCPKICHKGPCPPCETLSGPKPCFCGIRTVNKPCSDPNRSCGEVCNKL